MSSALEAHSLRFTYPDGQRGLEDVSFTLAPGEKVALIGSNGAGKSTLLLQLLGILVGGGVVCVEGTALTARSAPALRARVGLVFQNPDDQLFCPTVLEDVAYGPLYQGLPEAEARRRAGEALDAVGMRGYEQRSPHHLSLGEKKRIAIATVLSMRPSILLFDEPTAGLDPRARRGLIALLARLPQTMLTATHDLAFAAALLPRALFLDQGRLVADRPTPDLLADTAFLEAHGL